MADGFTTYERGDVIWVVYHDQGSTRVYAANEADALVRFLAKYPTRSVRKIIRA